MFKSLFYGKFFFFLIPQIADLKDESPDGETLSQGSDDHLSAAAEEETSAVTVSFKWKISLRLCPNSFLTHYIVHYI